MRHSVDAVNQEVGQPGWYYLGLGMSQSPWTPDSRWLGFVAQRANQTGYATWIIATDDSQLFKVADGEIIAWLP
jgi:hypothetical protein